MTSAGQFLTFPLPSLEGGSITTIKTLSVSAWIRITSIPGSQATIFATHKADVKKIFVMRKYSCFLGNSSWV